MQLKARVVRISIADDLIVQVDVELGTVLVRGWLRAVTPKKLGDTFWLPVDYTVIPTVCFTYDGSPYQVLLLKYIGREPEKARK